MFALFFILLLMTVVLFIVSVVKPPIDKKTKKRHKRRDVFIGFGVLTILFFILCLVTAPQSSNDNTKASNVTKASSSPSERPSPTTTPSPSTSPALTGFGALEEDWNTNHHADSRYTNTYDPSPDLGEDGGQTFNDKYYPVNMIGGRALNYQMRFPHGQNVKVTQQQGMKEFPSDAKILWSKEISSDASNGCYVVEINSQTLAQTLKDSGDASMELGTEPSANNHNTQYDPSNIDTGIFSNLIDAKTPSDFTGC